MADPLSVTASIASLIMIAESVFRRTYHYVKNVHGAPNEVKDLASSVGALSGILHHLQLVAQQLEGETFDTAIQIKHISSCRQTIEKVTEVLDKYGPASDSKRMDKMKRLKWPLVATEVKSLTAEINQHKSTLSLALNVDTISGLLKALSGQDGIRDSIDEVKIELRHMREAKTRIDISKERREILDWIQPFDPYQHHSMNLKLRHPETGLWLIDSEKFQSWVTTSNSRLWCHGIPGAGKTVLCASVIQEALGYGSANAAIAFFYCDYKSPLTHNPRNILGSLARQLAIQDEDSFAKLQKFHEEKHPKDLPSIDFSPEDLRDLVLSMASGFNDVMVLVDALDECGSQVKYVTQLLASLSDNREVRNIKSLFLSRDEPDVRFILENFVQISIAASSTDLRLFVGAQVELRTRNRDLRIKDASLKDEIMERLVEKADGMFRWVACQMDWLCELPNDAARRKALSNLPPSLHATYDRILRRVKDSNKEVQELVQRSLRWIVCARKQLSTPALCEAVSINVGDTSLDRTAISDEEEILRWCSSLVRKSVSEDCLELAHFTVKEYLLSDDVLSHAEFSVYHVSPDSADLELAKSCLTYLAFEDFGKDIIDFKKAASDRQATFPFYWYAVRYWHEHVRKHMKEREAFDLAKQLLHPSKPPIFLSWAQERVIKILLDSKYNSRDLGSIAPLHFAAALALPEVCSWLLTNQRDVGQSSILGFPLDCALLGVRVLKYPDGPILKGRHESLPAEHKISRSSTIRLLIDFGANVQSSLFYPSPFHIAVHLSDKVSCVELLRGGVVMESDLLVKFNKNPKLAGEILKGIERHDIRCADYGLLLSAALGSDQRDPHNSLQLLPQDTQNGGALTNYCLNAFVNAAEYGQIEIVQQLWASYKLDINAAAGSAKCPALHAAAANDHVDIVRFLLDHGADCNLGNRHGQTALHSAIQGSSGCLPMILEGISNINLGDKGGYTAWHEAAGAHNLPALIAMKRFTKDGKLPMSLRAGNGQTLLHCAARSGSREALAFVMDDCDESMACDTSSDGSTVLHLAVAADSLEAVRYLIDRKCNFQALKNDGSNVLHCAIWADEPSQKMIELLLDQGVSPCKARGDGLTPIDLLSMFGGRGGRSLSILKMLTHNITSLQWTDVDELSALRQICQIHTKTVKFWRMDAIEVLLHTSADASSRERMCNKAISYIVKSWNRLISSGELSVGNLEKSAALSHDMIMSILEYIQDEALVLQVRTELLCLAIESKNEEVAHKVLIHLPSVDAVAPRISQMSPLLLACYCGTSIDLLKEVVRRSKVDRSIAGISCSLYRHACSGRRSDIKASFMVLLNSDFNVNDHDPYGCTPLMFAARSGDAAAVDALIEHGADTSATDHWGWSANHHACETGNQELLPILEDRFKDWCSPITIEFGSEHFEDATIMHLAASKNNEALNYLLQTDPAPEINGLTRHKETPLFIAALYGVSRNVSLLLDRHADVTLLDSRDGISALHVAAQVGRSDIVKIFIKSGCDLRLQDRSGLNPELTAYKNGHGDLAELLRIKTSGKYTLKLPVMYIGLSIFADQSVETHSNLVAIQGEAGPSPEFLKLAIDHGDLKMCEVLIADGVNCNKGFSQCNGCSPLLYAFTRGEIDIARILIFEGASIAGIACSVSKRQGYTVFHFAASLGDAAILSSLFDKYPQDTNYCCQPVHPLHLAIAGGHTECVKILTDRAGKRQGSAPSTYPCGSQPDLNDMLNGRVASTDWEWYILPDTTFEEKRLSTATSLHIAATFGHVAMAEYLLSLGASVASTDAILRTPLHCAADHGQVEMVQTLMKWGANPNAVDDVLGTPAMDAAERSNNVPEILRALARGGADLTLKDWSGESVLYRALYADNWSAAIYLINNHECCSLGDILKHGDSVLNSLFSWTVPPYLMSFLLNVAPDPSVYEPCRNNVLSAVVKRNNPDYLRRLLRRLPKPLIPKSLGHRSFPFGTPLYTAACRAADKVIDMLLDAGAQMELEGGEHGSPLMGACATGRLEMVKMLVSRGAKTSYMKDGQVIDAYSAAKNHPDVRRWLLVGRYTGLRFIADGKASD